MNQWRTSNKTQLHIFPRKNLENFNIVPINPSGQEFDPEKHEAVSTVNNPGEKDNFVTNTLERGWTLNERVVKPALVVVNKK